MAIFIELVTDAFEENLAAQSRGLDTVAGGARRAGKRVARRPTRGLEIKEDTHASIKVILSDGSELPLIDSSSADGVSSGGYSNFILQSVAEARMEKHQIVETFGAAYIFFFGENPRFLDVSAVIVNSHDFNWEAEWWANYEENFRGTKLVEKGGRLYLFYDDTIVEGYMLMCQATKVSDQPHLIQMSFRLFLTNYRNISFIGSPHYPIHEGAIIPDASDVVDATQGPTGSESLASVVSNGAFSSAPRLSELLADASARRNVPVRGLIADNFDEYVGLPSNAVTMGASPASSGGLPVLPPGAQEQLESDDLTQDTVNQLGDHGADVNSPSTLSDLGLMPNFESDARSPATFRPKEGTAFGFGLGGETTQDDANNPTGSFRQDPLGAIFGGGVGLGLGVSTGVGFSLGDNRFDEGTGDPKYGFRSSFSSGAGFGETGYGDFGGPGFGSGQGADGDPGFKDPSRFTFAGVAQQKAAFSKFRKPRPDQSSFGKGAGIASSSSGLSGGSSVRIGGKPSAFSLISVGGTLSL